MTMRIILAGFLGAVAMFIWSFVAHMFLPLGEAGLREMNNESAVVDAMRSNLGDTKGLYIFPGTGLGPDATKEQKQEAMKQAEAKMANGPSGLLLYHPRRAFSFPQKLGIEFLTEFAEALLLAFLLAQARIDSFGGRAGFSMAAGILTAICTNVSYWNWYGFPKRYTAAYMFIQFVDILVAGIVAALVLGRRSSQTT